MDGPSELDLGDWQHPAPTESFPAHPLPTVSNAGYPGHPTNSLSCLQKGPSEPQPRLIPGPAGRAPGSGRNPGSRQPAGLAGAAAERVDADFLAQPWQAALSCLDLDNFDERHPFLQNNVRTASALAKSAKLSRLVAIVVTLQRTYSGQAFIRLKDPTGTIGGTISKQALDAEPGIQPGSVLILEKVTVLRLPSLRPLHHICITLDNIAQVVPAAPVASQQQFSSQPLRPPAFGIPMLPAPLAAEPPTQPTLPPAHFQRQPAWASEQPAGKGSEVGVTAHCVLATSQVGSGTGSQHGANGAGCGSESQTHHGRPCPAVAQQRPEMSAPHRPNLFVQPARNALQQCNSQLVGGQQQQQEQYKPAAQPFQTVQLHSQPTQQGVSQPHRSEMRESNSLRQQQVEPQQPHFFNGGQPATSHNLQSARPMQSSQGQQSSHHMGPPPPRLGQGMSLHNRQLPSDSELGLRIPLPLNQPPLEEHRQNGSAKPPGQIASRGTAWLQGLLQELPPTVDFGCSQATQGAGQPAEVALRTDAAAGERDAKRSRLEECQLGAEAGFGDGIDELMAGLEDELGL